MTDTNRLHTKRCLAHALICAVENLRDAEGGSDFDFRIAVQQNTPLTWADEYLASDTVTCLCPEPASTADARQPASAVMTVAHSLITEHAGMASEELVSPDKSQTDGWLFTYGPRSAELAQLGAGEPFAVSVWGRGGKSEGRFSLPANSAAGDVAAAIVRALGVTE